MWLHFRRRNIVAPGTAIVSCSNTVSYRKNTGYRNAYIQKSGTSMSAPIVSGIVMSIILNKPHLSAKEIKEIVLKGTVDVGLPKNMQGYGMTSCNRIRDLVLNT